MNPKYPPLVQKILDQHFRALYHAILASGFCTKCYREPQAKDKACCEACLAKARANAEKRNRANGQKPWQPGKPGRPPLNRTIE